METQNKLMNETKRHVKSRLCRVSGSMTEMMEIQAENPTFHVLFIPGNPVIIQIDFIRQELESVKVPIILVGHSIGSYISLELLKKFSDKVVYCIGLYPFLTLNQQSTKQSLIGKLAASSVLSATASFLIASLRLLPMSAARLLVSKSIGASWSDTAVQATCTHLRQYHTMRNVLFMAKSEFREQSQIGIS
uniref:T19F11.2 protein n=1 Tax=Arabidopsis thaliana TaxID=3702 RepID=Q9SRN3_ARATH|nr:unknown protein [Arabidopsis thaliana]